MIAVAMGNENEIRRDFVHLDLFRQWIRGDEWIEEQRFAACVDRETSMAVVGKFHPDRSRRGGNFSRSGDLKSPY
jgi:hypothetical protein